MVKETIIENVKDAVAVASAIVESAQKEVIWTVPSDVSGLGAHYGLNEMAKKLKKKADTYGESLRTPIPILTSCPSI